MEKYEINKMEKEVQEAIERLHKKLSMFSIIALLLFFVINLIFSFIDKLVSDTSFHEVFAIVSIVAIIIDRCYSYMIRKMCEKQIKANGKLNIAMKTLCITTVYVLPLMAIFPSLGYLLC